MSGGEAFDPDHVLMRDARQAERDRSLQPSLRGEVRELLGEYSVEAELANGPLPDRSEYWSHRALLTQGKLRAAVERARDSKPKGAK